MLALAFRYLGDNEPITERKAMNAQQILSAVRDHVEKNGMTGGSYMLFENEAVCPRGQVGHFSGVNTLAPCDLPPEGLAALKALDAASPKHETARELQFVGQDAELGFRVGAFWSRHDQLAMIDNAKEILQTQELEHALATTTSEQAPASNQDEQFAVPVG